MVKLLKTAIIIEWRKVGAYRNVSSTVASTNGVVVLNVL